MEKSPVILLAEDNDDTRGVYSFILRHFGYEVQEASTGRDALDFTLALQPSLVLMDIGLPGLDGWQVSRMLKAEPTTCRIPLIAFSAGVVSVADLGECNSFDGFILKPISPLDLARRVDAYFDLLSIRPRTQAGANSA